MRIAIGWLKRLISRQAMPECQLLISDDWDADLNYPLEHLNLDHLGIADYDSHDAMKVAVN